MARRTFIDTTNAARLLPEVEGLATTAAVQAGDQKSLADAKAYTNTKVTGLATTAAVQAGDQSSLSNAKAYTDQKTAPLASSASVTAGDQKSLADAKAYTDEQVAGLDLGSGMPEGGQPGEVLTTGADGTAEWQAPADVADSPVADAAYDAAARANVPVLNGSTYTVDLSKSLNVLPALTRTYYITFSGTAPGADTYQDGMGTLLKIEGGARHLRWPSDVVIYGSAPEFGGSFASLVVVNGAVNLIWPSAGGGGGTSVQIISREDLLSGSVTIPPGGEAMVNVERPGKRGRVYVKNTNEHTYQYESSEWYRSESLGLLSGGLESEIRGPSFRIGRVLHPDGVTESTLQIWDTGPWESTMPEPGGGWLLAELPNDNQSRGPLAAIQDANPEVVASLSPLNPDGTEDYERVQIWVRWLPGWSPAWSDTSVDSDYWDMSRRWVPSPGDRTPLLPQITDYDWLWLRKHSQSDLEALGWTFPERLATKEELDTELGPPPEDWSV